MISLKSPWTLQRFGGNGQFRGGKGDDQIEGNRTYNVEICDGSNHTLLLGPDISGAIQFADGSELTFDEVERKEW